MERSGLEKQCSAVLGTRTEGQGIRGGGPKGIRQGGGPKGPRPLWLLALRPHGMGEAWQALPLWAAETEHSSTKSLCVLSLGDLGAYAGPRVEPLESLGLLHWHGHLSRQVTLPPISERPPRGATLPHSEPQGRQHPPRPAGLLTQELPPHPAPRNSLTPALSLLV